MFVIKLKNFNTFTATLAVAAFASGLTDMFRRFNVGPITFQGFLTIIAAVVSILLVFARAKIPKATFLMIWLVLFVILGCANLIWFSQTSSIPIQLALQNLLVFVAFVGFLLLSSIESYRNPHLLWYVNKGILYAALFAVVIYTFSLLIGGFGTSILMGARSFALFSLIGQTWFLAKWRYGSSRAMWFAIFNTIIIALSYSRTATILAIILYPISQISLKDLSQGLMRLALWILGIALIAYLAFNYVEPIRARFTEQGDNATVGGVKINTSGRNDLWPTVLNSAQESPWIGKGPGSVSTAILKVNKVAGHPHNDYLRILHDYGYIGLFLWLVGYYGLMCKTCRNWNWANRYDRNNAHIHLAAFLSSLIIGLAMLTDNVVVYLFVMLPVALLVGTSIGLGSRSQRLLKVQRRLNLINQNAC